MRATAKLEFEDVKDKLQKVFGEFGDSEGDGVGDLSIKEESCFYMKNSMQKEYSSRNFGYRGGYRGSAFQRSYISRSGQRGGRGKMRNQRNPVNGDGNVLRCHCCGSTRHFSYDCPHKKVDKGNMTVHITIVAVVSTRVDALGKGILDSACTKTVAGRTWVEEYLPCVESDNLRII